jgi:hypothetical protein
MDRGNARSSDLRLSALALSPLSWPHPHGRTPTIPPVFSNARRSTTRHQPLRGGGIIPPDKRKTRPRDRARAAATTIASGAILGRNHAEPIAHPHTHRESGRLPPRRVARSPIVQSPALRARDACLEFGHKRSDRGRTHALCNALRRGCARYLFLVSREAIDQSWPQQRIEVSRSREGSRHRAQGAPDEAGL